MTEIDSWHDDGASAWDDGDQPHYLQRFVDSFTANGRRQTADGKREFVPCDQVKFSPYLSLTVLYLQKTRK